jgi:3-phenylpropionate/trans-cinnamate dioxygenase ferredoxin component
MEDWVDVAPVAEFPTGSVRAVDVEGTAIAVFNLEGAYYAIEDLCSHEAESLSGGQVEGEEIICPRHGAHFSILTGAALSPPAYEPVATFPVRVADGMVQVRDDRWD